MKKIQVLQLGARDYSKLMPVSDRAEWHYEPDFSKLPEDRFDIFDLAILDREITEDELHDLFRFLKAYTLFITETVPVDRDSPTWQLMLRRRGKQVSPEELGTLLEEDLPDYFSESYGVKCLPYDLSVAQGFQGKTVWRGFEGVDLTGDFGDEMTQIAFWRYNVLNNRDQTYEFWLEYAKDASVELSLEFSTFSFLYGAVPQSIETWTFSENDLKDIVYIENKSNGREGLIFASLKAKGQGTLTVTALHNRLSRKGKGAFLPGGRRSVTSEREEIFYFFDPGNLRPPLNVYFSGYKTLEGFEGYHMLRNMAHPFLLISESRLEGGAFYIGSDEYEREIEQIIYNCMDEMGFRNTDVILSGISGGSYGALYYGCRLHPHTILLGKPLASMGDIAKNERLNRPGGFPTSLDMLHKFCGNLSPEAVIRLNSRFWDTFDRTEWDGTQFAVAYMLEDDYDGTAYENLQLHLKGAHVRIFGKGIHGRHNDDTTGIVNWFLKQYKRIIQEHFDDARSETGGRKNGEAVMEDLLE